ncbi:MAG: DNA primase [Pseudomonadota bacterium]
MSLPPGFLDDLRTRITLSQVVGRKVMWDERKSNRAKGDLWAPCPFHQERTASFHVDDRKGFYYCFGCHAKGDALGFLRATENLSFMDAVEALAREAGIPMPAQDPRAAEAAGRRTQLYEAMEAAVRHYRMQLKGAGGASARDYLARRGLSQATLDRFDIGWAPDARQGVFTALTAGGHKAEVLVAAGLCAEPEDKGGGKGGAAYDRFRGRIIFPIRDHRGRCIALGGRSLDPNARAKYLNSPETELFDKGRTLFNAGPARAAVSKGRPLLVTEGYMDVIALVEAGFEGAAAPLGTAITEDQLAMLWTIHPEPVVALDGDSAGIRAAMRLIDLALPRMEAGQGLRFAILPDGMDPDDLIRARGADAMRAVLAAAEPMVALLWRRETEGQVLDSPERKAALDKRLREVIRTIRDPSIRRHYAAEISRLRHEAFAPPPRTGPAGPGQRGRARGFERFRGQGHPLAATRTSLLARAAGPGSEEYLREAMILAIAAAYPAIVSEFEAELVRTEMTGPDHSVLRDAILSRAADGVSGAPPAPLDLEPQAALEKVLSLAHVRIAPPLRRPGETVLARLALAEELAKLAARRGAAAEIEEAMDDLGGIADEGVTWRLARAAEARRQAETAKRSDDAEPGEDRAALSAGLQRLIDSEVWVKRRS